MNHESTQRRSRHRRGIRAETVAALWLQLKAYRILARRYKTPGGEIDLVAQRGRTIAFVEVKARTTARDAAEAIHRHNQQRIIHAAQYYLAAHPQFGQYTLRFDAMLVTSWRRPPTHVVHAFDAC